MGELSKKIVSMLKSNAYDSVYVNTLAKLPIVVTREGTFIEINGDVYAIDSDTGREYIDGLHLIVHDTYDNGYTENDVVYLRTELMWWLRRKCKISNTKKFHYDDTWYSYRHSVDNPEETFGILEVSNLPFRPLNMLMNKKSFICRMDQLMFNGIMEPFMLFVNRKFVNWNVIDVVFDCDDTYLLLHGEEYNHFNLVDADVMMVILPFKTEYIGTEPDFIWNKNYDMLKDYMQDSLHVNENNKIQIEVPNMYSIYKKRGMIYNVGAWMYTQVYANHLGLLSSDRINKLKRMILSRITYDDSGNIISKYDTKFNALDRDSYDLKTYNDICHCDLDYLKERALFRFNNNGELDLKNGENIIANLDESMTVEIKEYNTSSILLDYSKYRESLFRESFIVFKNNLFNPETIIHNYGLNIFTINNSDKSKYSIISFKPAMIEHTIMHNDNFINRDYYINKILECAKSKDKESDIAKMIYLANEKLNYLYFDNILYEDNFNRGFDVIMDFNPLLLNDLNKTTIKSTTISGRVANENLNTIIDIETRRGLKIPRYRYKDHETYVIVFLNGELIENYCEMYAASNYFFLPVKNNFANGDVIELLYFTYCDNNEIHFKVTDNMISNKFEDSVDPEFCLSTIFNEYIRAEDAKIFAKYPENIMIYKDIIEERDDIAFNISYRRVTNGKLLVFKDVIQNKNYDFTAVSSRKFIYERLYVDEKAYRIKLSKRFRYCDNQKQYILFINGRRMDDDSFFITVPKYSRPFWGVYLYTRKFVSPEDRIEIFYVPEELYNINTEETPMQFNADGYIKTEKNNLNVPSNGDFYLYFINGKKIPSSDIIPIDSYTVRVKSDTKSLLRLNVNPICRSIDPDIFTYMKNDKLSNYDELIKYIKDTFGYSELDKLFNIRIKMSDIEEDAVWRNVDRIAIINEIIRDFWVTSGYPYNERPFVYDYELDEIIIKDYNGNYALPALDANPNINIVKNNIRLLYFNANKNENTVYEIGSSISNFKFDWEFTNPIGNASITIVSQYVNGIRIDNNARSYTSTEPVTENSSFYFEFNTMQGTIDKRFDVKFCNGIYYGVVDEDLLQHYNKERTILYLDKIFAVVAKDKHIPSIAELELRNESIDVTKKDNYIIYNIQLLKGKLPDGLINVEGELMAIYEDGHIYRDIIIAEDYVSGVMLTPEEESEILETLGTTYSATLDEYYNKNDLGRLMSTLTCKLQDNPSLDFDSYKIGSNNYFVYACPKRLAYDENGRRLIRFTMPDINDPDVIAYGKDDHTTPIYTDGSFNELDNTLNPLDECVMEFMDEFEYTNPSGYTETYVIWRTNGFFTRKYDDYIFKMNIKSEDDFVEEAIENGTVGKSESIRIVNTASPSGTDSNENIIFIDTLIW